MIPKRHERESHSRLRIEPYPINAHPPTASPSVAIGRYNVSQIGDLFEQANYLANSLHRAVSDHSSTNRSAWKIQWN
jgi:hypothetical protein